MQRRHFLPSLVGAAAAPLSMASTAKPITGSTSSSVVVEAVQMPAWVDRGGWRRPIGPGERIWSTESIETGAKASIVMQLPEGSLIRLGENTKLGIQQLEADSNTGQLLVRSKLKLLEGVFRFATSSVSRVMGQRQIELSMRTATAGVRGTDFWSMSDREHDATCLFEGRVDMQTDEQGSFALDQPTAFWARFFDKPLQPVGPGDSHPIAEVSGVYGTHSGERCCCLGWTVADISSWNRFSCTSI